MIAYAGFTGFLCGIILIVLVFGDEKAAFKSVPWGVIFMIMAGVAQQENAEERFPQNKLFIELFAVSFIGLLLLAVLAITGVYALVA